MCHRIYTTTTTKLRIKRPAWESSQRHLTLTFCHLLEKRKKRKHVRHEMSATPENALDGQPNYTHLLPWRVEFVECCDGNILNYNTTYNVYKSWPKKTRLTEPAWSPALACLIFTLHISWKHIKTIPDGMCYINQPKFPIYIFTSSLKIKFQQKKKWTYTLGLWGVPPCAACFTPTSLIRSKQTDTPQNKRVELEINQRVCVAEMPFIKSKRVKKGNKNTFINAGTCSMGKMIYLGKKTH